MKVQFLKNWSDEQFEQIFCRDPRACHAHDARASGAYSSQWAKIEFLTRQKIGCTSQTLLRRIKREEVDSGEREGVTTSKRERFKALEREVKELRHTVRS